MPGEFQEGQKEQPTSKKIDQMLGNPNYSETQLFIQQGEEKNYSTSNELKTKMSELWWIKIMENPDIAEEIGKLIEAKYVSLVADGDRREPTLDLMRKLREKFLQAAKTRKQLTDEENPGNQVTKLKKRTDFSDEDQRGKEVYDVKSMRGTDAIGYGSFQWGLIPEKTAELLGMSEEELQATNILMTGIGTGDMADYSFPRKSTIQGIDISPKMGEIASERGFSTTSGNVSDSKTFDELPEQFRQPNIAVADYYLDINAEPVNAIENLAKILPENGKLMITILIPIDQRGADSKKSGVVDASGFKLSPEQNIGNTGNPWEDILKLKDKCQKFGLELNTFSITSYLQYDSGRTNKELPGEIRPSAILVFKKKNK